MAVHNPTHRDIKKSREYMEQMSWDDVYEILTRLQLTLNPVSNTLERVTGIQGNASIAFTYTGGNLTKIEKTIGSTTYTKTLTWDGGSLSSISAWS